MASACSRREGTQSCTTAPYQFQGEHDGILSMNWLTIRIPLHVTGVDAAPHQIVTMPAPAPESDSLIPGMLTCVRCKPSLFISFCV